MRADRLLSILMLLQARGKLTAKHLAHELDVSRRTILRDIDALSTAGIPIYAEGGRGGGIALDENYQMALTGLQAAEIRALFVSGMPSLLKDVGLETNVENSLLQLFAALPSFHQQAAEGVRQRLHIDPVWWWYEEKPLPFWGDLQKAVFDDHIISVTYEHHEGDVVERVLEPYSLVVKAGVWYLIAKREGNFRTYRTSRLQTLRVLARHFERDADFDLASYWESHVQAAKVNIATYVFTLRLPASKMDFLHYNIPGSAEITELEGGDWLTVEVRVPSLDSARMLVFGLGADTVVLDPPELRQAILATSREIVTTWPPESPPNERRA